MESGTCRLCIKSKTLVKSHLAPRALYDLCRPPDGDPVLITKAVVMRTSRQTRDRVLCLGCEDLLNRSGESWLLPLLATAEGTFPFYDLVSGVPADITLPDGAAYSTVRNPKIHRGKLAHFALGIFWKASAYSWSGNSQLPRIELGPYREPLRNFILGIGPFPKEMSLVVGVLPSPVKLISFCEPYEATKSSFRTFCLYVPGILFLLYVGKTLSDDVRRSCFVANELHPIVVSDFSRQIVSMLREVTERAHNARSVRGQIAELSRPLVERDRDRS